MQGKTAQMVEERLGYRGQTEAEAEARWSERMRAKKWGMCVLMAKVSSRAV